MFSLFKYQRNLWFWKLRYYLSSSVFHINKVFFQLKEKGKQAQESVYIIKELIKTTASSFLVSFLIVGLLEVIEYTLLNFISNSGPLFIRSFFDYFLVLHNQIIISVTSLEVLLSVVASISGIFLGLYFTAISVVASSVFAGVPGSVRDLLLKEKFGNRYIKTLAILTSVCIILLGYRVFGGYPGVFTSLFVIVLGCFGIFCFVVLGLRAFYFFDPTQLSNTIFYELKSNIRLSTINGLRWADANFQAHYQRLAGRNVSTLSDLMRICLKRTDLEKASLPAVLQRTVLSMRDYGRQRSYIPSDSRWYTRVPRYKDWFLTDFSTLEIALETQTAILPEMVPNPYWLENEFTEILSSAVERLLQKNNFEPVYTTLNVLNMYLRTLGSNLELKKGKEIINKICIPIKKYFEDKPLGTHQRDREMEFALFDTYGLTVLSLALGFYKLIASLSVQSVSEKIDSINWKNEKSLYEADLPPLLLQGLEFVQRRLKFEWTVEGKVVSPSWYIKQLIIVRYLKLFQETTGELLSSLEQFFVSKSGTLLSKKSFILAAHHSQRGIEMCNKMTAHVPSLKTLVKELEEMAINKDLFWPEWDWNEIEDRVNRSHDTLVENLAKCIPMLSSSEHRDDFPDFFGQTYNTVCQDCYESMILRKTNKFENLFPLLFLGSLTAHEKLRKKLKDWQSEPLLTIASEPLVDIMELSGYAKVYSELFDISEIWNVCEATWNKYFDSHSHSTNAVKSLIELYKYRKGLFQISARDILRTNWKISFNNKLQEMSLVDDIFSSSRYPRDRDMKPKHKSSLIRALCRGRYEPHASAAEVFIMTYLLKRPESQGIEFKDIWGLSRAIEREQDGGKGDI